MLESGLGLQLKTRVSVEGQGYGTRLGLAFVVRVGICSQGYGSRLELTFRVRVALRVRAISGLERIKC